MLKYVINNFVWTAKPATKDESLYKKPDGYKSSQSSSVIRLHSSTK
jgi:hypothetical protein